MNRSNLSLQKYLVLAAVTFSASFGDTFLDIGMKHLGPVPLSHLGLLIAALKTPWILAGIVLLLGFFASYLTALSWADLTFVLPATSLGYAVVALLSKFWLHEHISTARWIGVLLIVAGVGSVTQGPAYTPQSDSGVAPPANISKVHRG